LLQTDSAHTVVLINRGHPTDTSFQFDRVELLNLDADPTVLAAPSLGNGTPTTQAVASTTNSPLQSPTSSPGSSPSSSISGSSKISSSGSTGGGSTSDGSTSGGRCPFFIIALIQELIQLVSATSLGQTVTLTQQITNAGHSALVTSTSTVIIDTTGKQANNHHPLPTGAIVGIAIGALVILALFIAGCFVLMRRRRRSRGHQVLEDNELKTRQAPRCVWLPFTFKFQDAY
jgi:acid phosphatase family membrane protein YuiD